MCKHPLKAFPIGFNESTSKPIYKITSYKIDHVEKRGSNYTVAETPFVSAAAEKVIKEFVEIPCGKCIDCRLQYSRQWADRCMYERIYYGENEVWFLTLTYDEEHIIDINHEVFPGTLVKEHLQKFLKRLRRECDYHGYSDKLRYFACGEYGSTTYRPHYHMILYGLDVQKIGLDPWLPSKSGHEQWRSPFLEKIWKNGMVTCSKVSWDTCAYTARYTLKKAMGYDPKLYEKAGLLPEFVVMSRRPGIGSEYYDENKDKIYEFDEIIQKSPDGGRKAKPPKYFDHRLEKDNPRLYEEIKNKRKECADYSKKLKLSKTDLSYEELLLVEENVLKRKIQALKREGV